MQTKESVFEETYRNYLKQITALPLSSIAPRLGAEAEGQKIKITLFTKEYEISAAGIVGPAGQKPTHDICVILSKHILLCPDAPTKQHDWVSFKDLKDSAPLINYFSNEVERAIASYFSGRLLDLTEACKVLSGYAPAIEVSYDLAVQFDALPRIPVVLLFNDADEEFAARCTVLFESGAETYLDAECLAMLGWQLFSHLKKAIDVQQH